MHLGGTTLIWWGTAPKCPTVATSGPYAYKGNLLCKLNISVPKACGQIIKYQFIPFKRKYFHKTSKIKQ
jgi:hypothetical protein